MTLAPAFARADDLRLEATSLPVPLLQDGKVNVVVEASGVEPIGDGRRLLVAHDKDPALYIVDAASGRILGEPHHLAAISQEKRGRPQVGGHGPRLRGQFLSDRSAQR